MTQVILQPSGNPIGRENFNNTITRQVDLNKVLSYIDNDDHKAYLKEIYIDGLVPVWGVTPGKNNVNVSKWDKIDSGDITLFSGNKKIFASGVVTYKFRARELAIGLWGYKTDEETWEYIYLLDEIKEHAIPVPKLNKLVGYASNNNIMGFSVLSEEKSTLISEAFELNSNVYFPDVSEEDFEDAIDVLDNSESLDVERKSKARKEQAFLRRYLFKNKKESTCAICNKEYPVEFLVAAHIKKRSHCTHEERLDYKNIVIPMCKFGCDELFEKGYLAVLNGKVKPLKRIKNSIIESYINEIVANECSHCREENEVYFNWHTEFHSI